MTDNQKLADGLLKLQETDLDGYLNETSDKLLKSVIDEARATFPELFAGKTSQEIINEIAAVVRRAERKGVDQ